MFDDDEDDAGLDEAIVTYLALARGIASRGSVDLYRAMLLSFDGERVLINMDCLGSSWALAREGAGVYAPYAPGRGRSVEVVVVARVASKDIGWDESLENYLLHPGEMEVAVLNNRRVLVTEVGGNRLAKPVVANTGPAGEYWSENKRCIEGKRVGIAVKAQ